MTFTDKSGSSSFQDKLAKRNEIDRKSLIRELSKLKETERRDARVIDIAKHRFRSRCKKLGVGPVVSSHCKVTDVRMYETHNPGFCYHCDGAIKETDSGSVDRPIVNEDDAYEYVRAMLFTDGQVDPEKLLCLHLVTAHTSEVDPRVPQTTNFASGFGSDFYQFGSDSEGSSRSNGAWNDILPCYVMEIENGSSWRKSQRELRRAGIEETAGEEKLRDFELSYEIRGSDGAAKPVDKMAAANHAKMAAAQRPKMAVSGYEFTPRGTCNLAVDDPSKHEYSRLTQKYDLWIANCNTDRACASGKKTSVTSSICVRIDRSLTMLKKKSERDVPVNDEKRRGKSTRDDSITIKSSFQSLENSARLNEKPYGNRQLQGSSSSHDSAPRGAARRYATIRFRHRVYLNFPIRSFALDERDYRIVDILVNDQIRVLVRSILRVLERLNPGKMRWILETSGDREKIRDLFAREHIRKFVESLLEQPIVTSPRSFVVTRVIAVDRIDARLANLIDDELVAVTLELPPCPALELLLAEIHNDTSGNPKAAGAPNDLGTRARKPEKAPPDIGHSDPDRVILGRMTNSQRILVGRTCAALKNRRINNEGLIREKIPLAAFITTILSRESIKSLTRGTIYSKYAGTTSAPEEKVDRNVTHSETLTGSMLAKVRRDVAEQETKRRFDSFFAN